MPFPAHVAPFVLALLGLIYGGTMIDAERATDYVVVVIGAGRGIGDRRGWRTSMSSGRPSMPCWTKRASRCTRA